MYSRLSNFGNYFFQPKKTNEIKSNFSRSDVAESDIDFVLLKEKKEKPTITINNNLLSISIHDDYDGGFTPINQYRFRTANTKPLKALNYDPNKPLNPNSSHKVYKGIEITTLLYHFIKEVEHDMAYVEAFNGQLYELSLLYGFARAVVRVDDTKPGDLKTSSKGIIDFKTFADPDSMLTQELLANPINRRRFNLCSAVTVRMKEDDFHRGNLTRPHQSSPGFQMFDADCANWDGTWEIKGPASGDGPYPLRDPVTAFSVNKNDLLHNNARYSPSKTNPMREQVGPVLNLPNNPWKLEETVIVNAVAADPNTLPIYFETYVDWMIDISPRVKAIAELNIPGDLTVKQTGKKVIDLYVDLNKQTDAQYWAILPKNLEFYDFLEKHSESMLKHILIRSMIRNERLVKEKEEAMNEAEEKERFSDQFNRAQNDFNHMIERYNLLIEMTNKFKINSIPDDVSITNYAMEIIPKITPIRATELISEANTIASEMLALENQAGTENWKFYDKFDYQFNPEAKLVPTNAVKLKV